MVQNDKKFCLLHFIFLEVYVIWFWFLVHFCKMMASPDSFLFYQNFDFLGFWGGGKRAKNAPKWQKDLVSHFVSQELYLIWLWFFGHICKIMISPAIFSFFQNSVFFTVRGGGGGLKGQKLTHGTNSNL